MVGWNWGSLGAFRRLNIDRRVHHTVRRLKFRGPVPIRRRIVPCLLNGGGSIVTLTRANANGATSCNVPMVRGASTDDGRARTVVLDPAHRLYLRVTSSLGDFTGCVSNLRVTTICNNASVKDRVHALGRNIRVVITAPNHLLSLVGHNITRLRGIGGIILSRTSRVLGVNFSRDVGTVFRGIPRSEGALLFSTAVDGSVRGVTLGCLRSRGRVIINSHGRNTRRMGRVCCLMGTGSGCLALGHIISFCPHVFTVVFYHAGLRARSVTSGLVGSNCGTRTLRNSLDRRRHSLAVRGFHGRAIRFLITASITTHNLSMSSLARIVGCNLPSSITDCARQDNHANHTKGGKASVSVVRAERGFGIHRVRGRVNGSFISNILPAPRRVYGGRLFGAVSSVVGASISRSRVRPCVTRVGHRFRCVSGRSVVGGVIAVAFNGFLSCCGGTPRVVGPRANGNSHNNRNHKDHNRNHNGISGNHEGRRARTKFGELFVGLNGTSNFCPNRVVRCLGGRIGNHRRINRVSLLDGFTCVRIPRRSTGHIVGTLGNARCGNEAIEYGSTSRRNRNETTHNNHDSRNENTHSSREKNHDSRNHNHENSSRSTESSHKGKKHKDHNRSHNNEGSHPRRSANS